MSATATANNQRTTVGRCSLMPYAVFLVFVLAGCHHHDSGIKWTEAIALPALPANDKLPRFLDQNPDCLDSNETQAMIRWMFFAYGTFDQADAGTMLIPTCKRGVVTFLAHSPSEHMSMVLDVEFTSSEGVQWLIERINCSGIPAFYQLSNDRRVAIVLAE